MTPGIKARSFVFRFENKLFHDKIIKVKLIYVAHVPK